MASAAIDAGYIATSYSLPESTITSLLDKPTVEHVKALLEKIEEKAREFEDAQAEKLRSDVELETAVRNGNTRAKQLKDSVDKGLKEVEELRRKLAAEETTRANVESELQNIRSSSSTSSSQVEAFQSRISSLESANRDALALLESKSTAHDKLAEELSTQQLKIVALRREVSELETKVQSSDNASMQFKFREQRLQEEVELLKKRDEWNEEELKRRTTEHTKYRKEKTAQVAQLQRNIEDVTQANETLRSTETQLRNRLDEVTRKLEDAYVQIQNKDEDAVRRDNSSRAERDNALRLAELQKKSAETARARQQELERAMDQLKEDAAAEIGNLQADVNAEREDKESAEHRVEELERRVEELANEVTAAQQAPATPRRSLNGVGGHAMSGRAGSPMTPGGSQLKPNMTNTQLVAEYSRLKSELATEKASRLELKTQFDDMISDLENRQPEFEELRMDHGRLQAELEEASALIEQSHQDRDAARKAARKWESSASGFAKEAELLRQQLRDFSMQIKLLLVELQMREEGMQSPTADQQAQYEALVRGDIEESQLEGQSGVGKWITQRLVVFRSVTELQEQNREQLRLLRKLGEEMEGEDARAKKKQQEKDQQELEELRLKLVEYKDTIQSLTTRSDSYVRERDMFRRMLAHRGQLPQGLDVSAMFSQSLDGSFMPGTPSRAQSTEPSADARALADHIKLLKELQQHFDAYREEAATDQAALKRQNDQLSREKSDLQGENARLMSKEAIAQERYGLLNSSYSMLKTENSELQKRSQILAETAAKQDLKTQQVAEELIQAQALAESKRNETANLKAEKDLWKRFETRLAEDNQSLLEERSRLNKMVSDLQSLQNERELADSETRRRLQTRAETLESELSAAKRKLDEEVEQSKKAALRREYEIDQNRQRIDDLLKSSANYKEELVAIKTQRDQLQARVDELKIELRNAEEKAQALQPRLTSRPTPGALAIQTDENALTREQELGIEVADLKRDLDLKEAKLQSVQDEIEQYKAIAQTAEEELQQMNETSDRYRQETDAALTGKDGRILDLEKRVEEISSELATTNTELSELRSKADEASSKFNDQKNIYESELARLRDESDRLTETARLHQEDLKAQAEIAQQAQQNYEDELVKHAEAASSLQKIRGEHNTLKTEVAGYKAEAEAAKLSLSQSEESWSETRAKYEQEITEIKNSREELKTQNRRLHTQLEDLSKQIDSLKQSRAAGAAGSEDTIATLDPTSNNLQDIIRYLRQEKEIVDMQYELQIQESKRLQQQLAYAQTQLDDVREKLEAERRSNTSASEQATSHSKLMQTINELNLFRESNSSLRNEARSAQEQLARKAKEVEDLIAQLEPLKTKAREAEYELESKTGEIKLLQEDRDRWQKRTQDIMQKYDRVDPTELQELRDQITKLQEERDAAVAEKAPLQKEVNAIDEKINAAIKEAETKLEARLEAGFQERRQKLIDQSKERNRLNQATIKEKTLQLEAVTAEQNQLTAELASIKEELEVAKKARDEAVQQAESAAIAGDETEEGQLKEGGTEVMTDTERAILEALVNTAEEKAMANAERATALEQEVVVLKGNVEMLRAQIMEFEQSLATANAKAEAAQASGTTTIAEDTTGTSEELARLQADLTAAQQEVERLNANSPTTFTELGPQFDASATEQIEARIAVLKEKLEKEYADKIAEAIKAEEVKFSSRAQGMSKKLSTKLADARKDLETEMTKLKAEHQQELERIKAEPGTTAEPVAAAPIAPSEDAAPTTNGTSTNAKPAAYQPTEDEAKELLRTNNVIRNVVQGNIKSKVAAAVEEAKKEAQAERERAVQSAKELAEKRSTVQVNMAKNKANQLTAQIDVVKTAATQTPQRPVGEVWEIASKTKPGATIAPGRVSLAPGVTPAASSAPAPARGTPVTQQIASSAPPIIAPAVQQAVPAGSQGQPQAQAPSPGTFGAPSALPQLNRRPSQSAVPSNVPTPATNPFAGTVPTAGQNQPAGAGRGTNAGTGPAALRGITNNNAAPAGTSIPRPGSSLGGPAPQQQGQAGRGAGGNRGGSQLPRAGGSQVPRGNLGNRGNPQRGGRGGLQTSGLPQLGAAAGRGGGSPQRAGRGGMNPNAQNFAPGGAGAKRPNDGSGGNEEKRVKEG